MPAARPVTGNVRIIGGRWRGRRLPVVDSEGLRPSPDRLRETLFNWLAPVLPGARCLDLYAGTGVLGFEALSRGAAAVTMVESAPAVVAALRIAAERLGAADVTIAPADVPAWLRDCAQQFDVVFIDPPWGSGAWPRACEMLAAGALLAPGARVFVETPFDVELVPPTAGWEAARRTRAGHAAGQLFVVEENNPG